MASGSGLVNRRRGPVGRATGFHFQLIPGTPQTGVEVERDALSCRVEPAADGQPLAVQLGAVGYEADLWVVLDVEEIGRAQVLVTLGVVRVKAGRLDRQLDCRLVS